ncbi:MAG: glycosyltransferase [Euzebya sp.]
MHSLVNWRLLRQPPTGVSPAEPHLAVSVLIPARNEAQRVGPTLVAVLRQTGVDFEVILLDDGSDDDTSGVATTVAGGDDRFRVVTGSPLPPGWLGKPHACWQLAGQARGDVLVFMDCDVHLRHGALAACVDLLQHGEMDMVSPYPRQYGDGLAARLIQPLLQWSWLTFLPLRLAERTSAPSLSAGNGQLQVCRAHSYWVAGGHQRVAGEVIEDVALARSFKQTGFRVGMANGTELASCRMYDGWTELREGYSKSLWSAFGSRTGAAGTMLALWLLYMLPPVGAVWGIARGRRPVVALGAWGYAAGVAGRAHAAWRTGGRVSDAPAHPVSIGLLSYLTWRSWRAKSQGGLSWKGRRIP